VLGEHKRASWFSLLTVAMTPSRGETHRPVSWLRGQEADRPPKHGEPDRRGQALDDAALQALAERTLGVGFKDDRGRSDDQRADDTEPPRPAA
jgi:hypothetical protein